MLFSDPAEQNLNNVPDFIFRQFMPPWDIMPFCKAPPAAASGCVLGNENGVAPHGSLFAVIERAGRREPFCNEASCVGRDHGVIVFSGIAQLFFRQFEAAAEWRFCQTFF